MKNKICKNCGAMMHWHPLKEGWVCKLCGNFRKFKDFMSERRKLFED